MVFENRYEYRNEFRKSRIWQETRQAVYDNQSGLDFVTGEKLKENWNCHHCCVDHKKYTDVSNLYNFVAVNKGVHSYIHKVWNNHVTRDEYIETMKNDKIPDKYIVKLLLIFDKMDMLNIGGIEKFLFMNKVEYHFDESDKFFTTTTVKRLNIPNKNGWIYWNKMTPGYPQDVPVETERWISYLSEKYGYTKTDARLALELRHLCMWSSLKNLQRPEIQMKNKYWKEQQNLLYLEIPKITKIIFKYNEELR